MAGSNSPNAFDSGTARRPRKGTGLKFWLTASLAAIGMTALMTFIVISNPANRKRLPGSQGRKVRVGEHCQSSQAFVRS